MTIALPAQATARRTFKIDFSVPLLLTFAALLCVLIILPISWLVVYSLSESDPATKARVFTLAQFRTLFSDPDFVDPLITTVIVAFSSSVAC